MSARAHNKKRNAGLLYEFLVLNISKALVDGDQKKSGVALKVIKRHFKPGTELYKEFRLIRSLVQTTVSSEQVAASIIQEAKAAARSYDIRTLDREKSLLISTINRAIGDENFFDAQVNEYKIYATIQTPDHCKGRAARSNRFGGIPGNCPPSDEGDDEEAQ